MRFGKRYDNKKGLKRSFKKSGKSEDASFRVHQVHTVSNDEGVTHYPYSVAGANTGLWSTTHMTGDEKLLSDWKPMKAVTMTKANGDRLTATAIGSAFSPGGQETATLAGVVYAPGLHKNMISVPKLIEKGLSLKMLKHKCIIESKRNLDLCT